MKYFQRTWGAFLTLGLLLSCQFSFAQNVPTYASDFAEENLQYNPDGTILFNGVTVDQKLKTYLQEKSSEEQVFVFTFPDPETAKAVRPQLTALGGESVGPKFEHIPVQGVYATAEEVIAMTKIEGVYGIWENSSQQTELHDAVLVSSVKDAWEDSEFTTLNNGLALSGQGVGVLINDSGFDGDDTDLQTSAEGDFPTRLVQNVRGAALQSGTFEMGDNVAGDDTDQGGGHGSHCACIVGGDGRHSNKRVVGVAPNAQLIGYGSGAGLSILDVIGGYEYIIRHKEDYNIRVMSNSYGQTSDTTFTSFNQANATSIATKTLSDNGVIVVFSAGNSGGPTGKITGNFKTAPWVLCVGNGVKDGSLASSSSRGRPDPNGIHPSMREEIVATSDGNRYLWENRPTVTAPGTDIVSTRATLSALSGLSALDDAGLSPTELPYYTTLSGTSMACPHIAGIVALLLEANPDLEWRAVKAIIQRTAIDAMSEQFFERGAGYVNAWAAAAAAFHGLCDVSEDATYEEKYGLPADGSFGFDDDPWKTCPLHPEVFERVKSSIPSPAGAESLCSPTEAVVTDPAADGGSPHTDVVEVTMHDETADDFKITMEVAGGLASWAGTPSAHIRYVVAFSHDRADGESPTITYFVTAANTGLGEEYFLSVRTAENPVRYTPQMEQAIPGEVDIIGNTITWTVPKAEMNVSKVPALRADPVERNAPGAAKDQRLTNWSAFTYQDGAIFFNGINVDDADGSCFRVLEQ